MSGRLKRTFFDNNCDVMSKKLLGKILCRKLDDGTILKGKIVETEMYPGSTDKASHSFNAKKTKRNGAMFMDPGTSYVYYIYGMYFCFNISTKETGGAILIRALEPLQGLDEMRKFRQTKLKSPKKFKDKDLCSGPSKLCQALNIAISHNELDLTQDEANLWVEDADDLEDDQIYVSKRIGINSYGSDSADKLYR